MSFPSKGIDRSVAHILRASGTTDHARNVRPSPPGFNRWGGGKRGGWGKLFTNKLTGIASSTQINHLIVAPKATGASPSLAGYTNVTVSDNFVGRVGGVKGGGGLGASNLAYAPTDPANARFDLVTFRKNYLGGGEHRVAGTYGFRVQTTTLGLSDTDTLTDALQGGVVFDWDDTTSGGYPGLAVLYNCVNDVTLQMYGAGTATLTNNNAGTMGEPHGFGPFIRGSALLEQHIGACLMRDSVDGDVRLEIVKVDKSTRTTLAYSRTITLPNADAWGTDPTDTVPDLFIRIWETAGVINATCSWKRQGVGAALTPADMQGVPVFGDDSANAVLACSTSSTSFLGNTRVGAVALFTAGGVVSNCDNRWYVRSITYTKLVPPKPTDLNSCTRSSQPLFSGGTYFMPDGCEGVSVTTGGTVQKNLANWFAPNDSLAGITAPYIDLSWPVVKGNTAANQSSYILLTPNGSSPARWHVEVAGRLNSITALDGTGTDTEDVCGAVFRATSDRKNGILVEVMHGAGAPTAKEYMGSTHQDHYSQIRFVGLCNGERFVLDTFTPADSHMHPFRAEVRQRWYDSGGNVSVMTLAWKCNGITLRTFTPSTMSGYAAWIARFTTLGIASQITSMNSSTSCGLCFRGDDAPPPNWNAWGGFIVDTTVEDSGSQVVAEYDGQVYAWLSGWIYSGPASGGTASAIIGGSGGGPKNSLVQTATIGNLLFMCDGDVTLYTSVNRTGNGSIQGLIDVFAASSRLAPQNCRFCAVFLGRLVLARPDTDPTFIGFSASDYGLAADAVLPPLDWDYGRDPSESSAIAFAAPEAITAVVPGPNDTLFVGGPSRISMFVGDPGINGQVLLRTAKTGIIGPRAWCYDDHNNLYFIGGAGGLWMLPAGGGDPINMDRGRWGEAISKIDGASYFLQLQFNPVEREIIIFSTPVNHTTGAVHYVYHIMSDTCWEDTYDTAGEYMNPWATAQGDSSTASQRQPIMGGRDGYIRRYTPSLAYDEATAGTQTAIPCSVDLYPEQLLSQNIECLADQLQVTLNESSGSITGYWFADESAGAVAALGIGGQVANWTFASGYNTPVSIRYRGAAHKLRIYQNSASATLAIEEVSASFSPRGRRR